jgi:fibronectin-binding autotransporter adhesin
VLILAFTLFGASRAQAATFTWDGNGGVGNSNWSTAGNWTVAGVPTQPGTGLDDIQFAGGTKLSPNMQASYNINSLTFNTGAGLFVLTNTAATTLTIQGGGIVNNDNSTQTISISDITLGAAQSWNAGAVAGGSLAVNSAVNLNGNLLTVTGTNNSSIGGIVSGAAGLTKIGSGTLTLSAANTYTGVTTINVGVLSVGTIGNGGVAGNLGQASNAAANLVLGGGTLQYTGADASTDRNFTLTAATTSTIDVTTNNLTISGASTNTSGALTKIGSGTLTLSGANLYTGLTTVSDGTLAYGVNNALSSGAVTVSGGTLDIKTFSDTVGAVTLSGGGAINGTTGVLTGTSYAMQDGSASAILAGVGVALTKTTGGTVTLSGVNTYTGVTTINAGVLSVGTIGNGGVAGNLGQATNAAANLVLGGGTLQYTGADASTNRNFTLTAATTSTIDVTTNNLTISGASTNTSGALTKIGSGTLTLSGANLYTGLTTVSAGTLAYGVNNALSSGAVTVSGGTLDIKTFSDTVGAVTLSGGGAINGTTGVLTGTSYAMQDGSASAILGGAGATLTKSTGGTVTLSGANTYGGLTTVSAGTLRATTSASALGSGSLTLSGGTLELANDTGLAFNRNTTVSGNAAINSDVVTPGIGGVAHTLGTLSIGAQTLTIGAGANVQSGTTAGITFGAVTLTGNPTFSVGTDALLTMGAITSGGTARTITFGGAGDTSVTGIIDDATGAGNTTAVTKTGNGTLTLANANTYQAVTTISGGVVRATNGTALGTTAAGVTIASGAALELSGGIAIGAENITSLDGTGVSNGGALRNVSGDNSFAGTITLADVVVAAEKITSDGGTLTLSGALAEAGATAKNLTLGGAGALSFTGTGSSNSVVNITKEGIGSVTTSSTAFNDLTAGTITVKQGTLNLDYTAVSSRLDDTAVLALSGGTVNLQNGGSAHNEVVASTTINAGASDITRTSGTSVLRLNTITRNPGGTINFGGASIADTDTGTTNGILGTWATVGGTAYATTAVAAGADRPIIALAAYGQTVTRLSSGSKVIANTPTNHVQITDGTGGAADITLAAATTVIATLTNNATGGTSTINPNSGTLRVGGILNPNGSGALTLGNGTNNGTLTAATAGGELVIQNFSTTNNLTVNSVIADFTSASSLTTSGTGTTVLSAANTYTGTTTVAGGTLQIGDGGTTGSLSTSSAIVTNATLAFNRTDTVTQGTEFNSVISGTGGVTQKGSGTLVLNGTNTYAGVTTMDAGIVNVANLTNYGVAGSLGNRAFSDEAITDIGLYFEGGTLQYTGSTAQSTDRFMRVGLTGATIDASGSNSGATMTFSNTAPNVDSWADAGSRTITLTGSNTGDNTFAINIQEYNDGSGSHTSLVKSGSGTWVLTNPHNSDAQSNSYSTFGGYGGGTTVSGGTLGFANNAIGGGVVDITGNATLRWEAGNTQDITTGTGAGVARSVKVEDGVTATFNTNGNDVTLSNALTLGASGTAAVTKSGTGTLTLTAANTYSGATAISASGGTLEIGQGGSLASTSSVTVNSGGTLLLSGTTNYNRINDSAAVTLAGGTLSMGGSTSFDEQVGALTLSGNSVIDFGTLAGGNILRFADSTGATWGAFTLSIWNWTAGADHLYFGSVLGAGLPVGGLGKILFYTDSGTTPTGGSPANFGPDNGEVSPVPEPSAVLVGLSLLSLAGYRERRWFFRCREARREGVVPA